MGKVRVPIHQQPNKFVVLDTGPTVVGVNVFLPDGSLFRPSTSPAPAPSAQAFQNPLPPPAPGGVTVTVWGAIQGKPANIAAVEAMTGLGVVVRDSVGALRGKAFVPGANVTIVEDATSITLASTGGNIVSGTGGLWDLGDRISGIGRFDGGERV